MPGQDSVKLRIVLGRARMPAEEAARLRAGSFVLLDSLATDPVEIYADEQLIAYGQIVVLNDQFCIRVTQLLTARGLPVAA